MSTDEKDIQDLIQKFNNQQQGYSQNINNQNMMPQTPTFDNQGFESTPANIQAGPPPTPAPVGNTCPQCGMAHPPIPNGQKCPNAANKIKDQKTNTTIDVNQYLNTLQIILISQIEKKKIKDIKKMYTNITIELTKFLEEYEE